MQKLKWVGIGIFIFSALYILLHYMTFLNFIPWFVMVGFIAISAFAIVFIKLPGSRIAKICLGILSVILGFVITVGYLIFAQYYAAPLCQPLVEAQFQCEEWAPDLQCGEDGRCKALPTKHCIKFKGNIKESNGYSKLWNLSEKCINNMLPFPWGRTPSL